MEIYTLVRWCGCQSQAHKSNLGQDVNTTCGTQHLHNACIGTSRAIMDAATATCHPWNCKRKDGEHALHFPCAARVKQDQIIPHPFIPFFQSGYTCTCGWRGVLVVDMGSTNRHGTRDMRTISTGKAQKWVQNHLQLTRKCKAWNSPKPSTQPPSITA